MKKPLSRRAAGECARWVSLAVLLFLGNPPRTVASESTLSLVRSGKPAASVAILSDDPLRDPPGGWKPVQVSVEQAAKELVLHLRKISGVELPLERLDSSVEGGDKANGIPVLVGKLALDRLGKFSQDESAALKDPSGFVVRVQPDAILIAGTTPTGVACGVYAFLEKLGVRWFFPGELGTVIPRDAELRVAIGSFCERPTLSARHFQIKGVDEWVRRQRAGGLYFPSAHGIPIGKVTLKERPELFALVKGTRTERQLCVSSPEVLERAIAEARRYFQKNPKEPWLGMGPNDGGGFCECDGCRAWDGGDEDPFSGGISVTDRYIEFFNRVLAGIRDEYPDKQIAFYIYHNYMRPPVRVKPDANIAGALAPIALCRVHGMNNPVCPERSYLKGLIDAWKPILPNLYERGYWFNLADPGMMFIQIHRLRDEIPYYARNGARGYRTECSGQWAVQGPSLYIAGKLLWNSEADPDALLGDFCEKLFGPAAEPMRAYFSFLDQRMEEADYHAGGAFEMLQFYPAEARAAAGAHIEAARKLATDSPWKERVDLFASGFSFFDAFAGTIDAGNRQEWGEAARRLREMDALRAKLESHDPPMIGKGSESHFRRFFRPGIEQGISRSSGGNRMAAPLGIRWEFLIDPQRIGESLGYEKGGIVGGNWQEIASDKSWSSQGLRYYKGLAWYRQKVEIPEEFAAKRLFLWFNGVDESARVWVNGKRVGTGPVSAFTPFEVDATEAVRAGVNSVVVCVANLKVNELGTGGITGPAFFYAPEKGAEAKLENLKPLRETFP